MRLAVCTALAMAFACAHPETRREPPPTADREAPRHVHVWTGVASFYGGEFEGRRTASGAIYRSRRMTCAHRTLPFGTVLRVTDVETRKSVVVEVNDRGPYAKGRIVDLSMAAAQKLGIVDRGLARVTVEVVR
ncbi:MAG: septal ring lytic transglycosylase RlpA family protein [Myxococcales bacterium]